MRIIRLLTLVVGALCVARAAAAWAEQCTLQSGRQRVTVLELYTSEGCSSCPPADRWLSSLPKRGVGLDRAVLLAFHVDYWNQLGWVDRFSQARFSQRQHEVAVRNRNPQVYTPQLLLDGRTLRAGSLPDDLDDRLRSINAEPARATIRAEVARESSALQVNVDVEVIAPADGTNADLWLAAFENSLSTSVSRGENAGVLLNHDFVVRDVAGPFSMANNGRRHVERRLEAARDWDLRHTGLAVFVQDRSSGAVLQAAAMFPLCRP